jgi:hypothetical protein
MPMAGMNMDMMKNCCALMMKMMNDCSMPMMMSCNGMPLMCTCWSLAASVEKPGQCGMAGFSLAICGSVQAFR